MLTSKPELHIMSAPSFDPRNAGPPKSFTDQRGVKYETTADGDVVVVEPSFDADDSQDPKLVNNTARWHDSDQQGDEIPPTGSGKTKRGHARNLSEHFYDATTLSTKPLKEEEQGAQYFRGPPPPFPSETGQKHRRVYSGDVSNPSYAHRRVNSIGNSTAIKRKTYAQGRQHQRVDSAGLDVLTAAADVSREELEAAAGQRMARSPWDPPSAAGGRVFEISSYDYNNPSMNAPPPRGHHPSYHPPPPPQGYIPPAMGPPPGYSQPPYPATTYYVPPAGTYPRPGPPPNMGYPVQYSRAQEPYMKHSGAQHGVPGRRKPPIEVDRNDLGEEPSRNKNQAMSPTLPLQQSYWRGPGTTQGVQTFVTAIGVGDGNRTVHPTPAHRAATDDEMIPSIPSTVNTGHHRKLSSFSSLGPISSIFQGQQGEAGDPSSKGHHRATSSSISFLQGFDVGLEAADSSFLQNLHSSQSAPASAFSDPLPPSETKIAQERFSPDLNESDSSEGKDKLATGGTSKRVRRKCTVANCPNRVVQGGLCISHGAKRKTCKHPGCNKNVKKAGLCSTHGPARKRCEAEGCSKVSVQGGRCIAHGAKKKLCSKEGCTKQAILGGMCKKHHDQHKALTGQAPIDPICTVIDEDKAGENELEATQQTFAGSTHRPTHTRGLSIFQDLSADAVGNLLHTERGDGVDPDDAQSGHRHRSTFSRDFGIY